MRVVSLSNLTDMVFARDFAVPRDSCEAAQIRRASMLGNDLTSSSDDQ